MGDRDPGVGGGGDPGGDPGTTSNSTPASRSASALLAAAAEDERVAALEPDDAPARRAPRSISRALISSCGTDRVAMPGGRRLALPT